MTTPVRPVLRYHGGKWRLAPWVISHFPAHRVYVEPFGGAASVLLRKAPTRSEVYNDLDGEVVNLFRTLRDPGQAAELRELVRLTPFAREEYDAAHDLSAGAVERARRLLVRSFMGFGSRGASTLAPTGFRVTYQDGDGLPCRDWAGMPGALDAIVARLAGVLIEHRPAVEVMARFDGPDALHYVDPPYVLSARSTKQETYRHEMTDDEHRVLASVLHGVRGAVVLSGYRSALYDELYGDWECRTRKSRTNRNSERTEVVWLNPACAAALAHERDQGALDLGGAA